MKLKLMLLTFLVAAAGCTSFKTTILQRCTNDRFVPNFPQQKTSGLPVKLKVPSHVEVVINESYFIQKVNLDKDYVPTSDGVRTAYKEIPLCLDGHEIRPRSVSTKVIYTDKVFTVDFKRPIAGTLSLGAGGKDGVAFDAEQYFSSIQATYEERTIQDITAAIKTLDPMPAKASGVTLTAGTNLYSEEREVARARFDISSECWEEEMHAFVAKHVTDCQNPCSYLP